MAEALLRLRGMRVIGIVGSPRRGGNTDLLVERVLDGVRAHGLETEKILLAELDIRPCRACYSCTGSGRCVLDDDFSGLLEKTLGAKGVVLGSPTYVGTVTAQMKAFVDRVDCSQVEMVRGPDGRTRLRRRNRGRYGVVVAVCDLSPAAALRHCAEVMGACLRDLGAITVDEVLVRRLSDIGDVWKRPDLLAQAFRAGERLAAAIEAIGR
ncbi:flavodoxin family protein [Candidatus Bipolaricaulota sp. J31]